MSQRKEIFMEILRFKKDEFNLEGFMHYYNDNIEELTFEYPRYVSRICLIDKDYITESPCFTIVFFDGIRPPFSLYSTMKL